MLKRLPILCAALLALAACSQNSGNSSARHPAGQRDHRRNGASSQHRPAPRQPCGTGNHRPAPHRLPAARPHQPPQLRQPAAPAPFVDNGKWVEGKNYFLIDPAQPKLTGTDKIEVTEVFSYACPACNAYHPTMNQLVKQLPSNAVAAFLPASFMPQENWVTLQRAYLTAQALGVVEKTHDAMFDAAWKTGELATYDLQAGKPKPREAWPNLDDVAKFYAKYGVDTKQFIGVANSFSINTQMKRADDLMKAYGVDSTPTLIIDGKYRSRPLRRRRTRRSIELTQWLVAKEAAGK